VIVSCDRCGWRDSMLEAPEECPRCGAEINDDWSFYYYAIQNPGESRRNPQIRSFVVRPCADADEAHRNSMRAYAHTFCGRSPIICVASAFFDLPRHHRDGVLAHEIGHLLAGRAGDELDADAAFFEATGIRIKYRDSESGKCLQSLEAADSVALEGVFDFDFQGARTGVENERETTRIVYRSGDHEVDSMEEAKRFDDAVAVEVDDSGEERTLAWSARTANGDYWGKSGAGLFISAGNRVLLTLRSDEVQEPGTWGLPGGAMHRGDSVMKAAVREAREELGPLPPFRDTGERIEFIDGGFKFTTAIVVMDESVVDEWEPTLNWESDDCGWFHIDALPQPLHFGVEHIMEELGRRLS
jgi:8-oxo-dGTP pyrophosphatase MutT (NUDIX family)